jgi:hypothetical protein
MPATKSESSLFVDELEQCQEGGIKTIMSTIKIDIGELRSKYSNEVKKLTEFLEGKLKTKPDVADREITLKPKEKETEVISRDYLRVLLRKFLHREDLKEEFRVIAGKENVLIIKERKMVSE